jgi:hypothetical protein
MRSPIVWYAALVTTCIVAPYCVGLQPRRRWDWLAVRTTIGFLTWLLVGMAVVRAT